jgi:hypothetical protein
MQTTADVMAEKSHTDCIMDLMQFLVIAEQENDMYGFVTATQALESVQVMLGYDLEKFTKLKEIFTNVE